MSHVLNHGDTVGVLVLTGKHGEIFTVNSQGRIHRKIRLTPTGGGAAPAAASRRGGQSAPRFSRLADASRLAWVKKVMECINRTLVNLTEGTALVGSIVVCGGSDLQKIFKNELVLREVHHTLRNKIIYTPSGLDPTAEQRGKKLRKVADRSSGGKIGTSLLDYEIRALVEATLRQ